MGGNKSQNEPGAANATAGFKYWHVLIVLAVSWIVRFWFAWYMPAHVRSSDTFSWEGAARMLLLGQNPYKETTALNWPPFWLQCIYLMGKISVTVNVPFIYILRVCLAGVESLVIVVLFWLIRQLAPQARPFVPILLGIALNPIAILLIGQHCNFDVFVGLWMLLFVGQLAKYYRSADPMDWLGACLFLGLGILTKTVPLILVPMLAGGFRRVGWKTKLNGAALVLGPVTLGMSIIFVLAPDQVTTNVLAYRSAHGWFGLSGLLHLNGADNLVWLPDAFFYLLLIGAMAVTGVLFWKRETVAGREIVLWVAMFLAAIPALGPGYGPQYFYWFLPLLVASYVLYPGFWRRVLVACGLVAMATYLLEYGIVHSHGSYILWIMDQKQIRYASVEVQKRVEWWASQEGEVVFRLPLFGAFLMLLVIGIRMLNQNLRLATPVPVPVTKTKRAGEKNRR